VAVLTTATPHEMQAARVSAMFQAETGTRLQIRCSPLGATASAG